MDNHVFIRLYKGKSWISKFIKWHTRGEYSHAAIIVGGALYESKEFIGTRKRLAFDENVEYDDFIVETAQNQRAGMVEFLERQIGKPYDMLKVFAFVTRKRQDRKSLGKWFCSEIVFATLQKCGVKLFNLTEAWEVSPDLLKRSSFLKKIDIL